MKPPVNDKPVMLSEASLQLLLESAAEAGAKKALAAVGLHDDKAGRDVGDLRGLLDAFRAVKSTILTTIARIVTVAILAALAAAIWHKQ
jgi:hypothetical protein